MKEDGAGNETRGEILQTYGVVNGQARVTASRTRNWSGDGSYDKPGANADGTRSRQEITIYYAYDASGRPVPNDHDKVPLVHGVVILHVDDLVYPEDEHDREKPEDIGPARRDSRPG